MWLWIIITLVIAAVIFCVYKRRYALPKPLSTSSNDIILTQLAMLEERTKHLQGLEEDIEKIKDKQDADSKELRERLYNEYSKRLQDAVDLLKQTYGKMSETTANAFREITDRNVEVYRQTGKQLVSLTERLESAFKILEQREHNQMREEMRALRLKVDELERDPLRVQLEELADARAAQAVHELSVKKITTIFWCNNGEVKFKERIGQYQPDIYINNHRIKIVADEVTTGDVNSIREKTKKVADYMEGLNANVGYVIIPNAGVNSEELREIKRTVPRRGLYVVRLTEFAVHVRIWNDIVATGMVDTGIIVEKGHNFLQVLEPIFEEFLAVVQNLEQRDERDFMYRQNRYKEIKFFPSRVVDAVETKLPTSTSESTEK